MASIVIHRFTALRWPDGVIRDKELLAPTKRRYAAMVQLASRLCQRLTQLQRFLAFTGRHRPVVWMMMYSCAMTVGTWFTWGLYRSLAAIVVKTVFAVWERQLLAVLLNKALARPFR